MREAHVETASLTCGASLAVAIALPWLQFPLGKAAMVPVPLVTLSPGLQ